MAQPSVLGFSFESNISPSLAALLQSRLSLSDAQLWQVVVWWLLGLRWLELELRRRALRRRELRRAWWRG